MIKLGGLPSLAVVMLAMGLAAVLIAKRGKASLGVKLLPAMGVLIWIHGFNGLSVMNPEDVLRWHKFALVGELLFPLTLGFVARAFCTVSGDAVSDRGHWLWRGMLGTACVFSAVILFGSTHVMEESSQGEVVFVQPWGEFIWGVILLMLVVILAQFEHILRAVRDPLRYQLKFVLIGLGGLAGMATVQACQGLLDPIWNPTFAWISGATTLISLMLVGFGLGRWRFHEINNKIQVSHRALFASLTVMLVGGYFIVVGLLSEIMQQTGWELSRVFLTVVVFLSLIFFVTLNFSRLTRLKMQQFFARHFLRSKYDYRDKWLEVTQTFSSCREVQELWDRYLLWLSQTFVAPRITIWKRFEADEQFHQIRSVNTDSYPSPITQSHPVLGPLARSPEPIFATTVTSHSEEFLDFIRATQALVCVPISCAEGHLLGFSTLSQDQHGRGYDHDDFDLLRVVSHHVAMLLLQFHLQEAQTASAKWEVVHKFSGFYLHDLKNLASNLSMVAQNADQYGHDPEFQDSAMRTVKNTSQRIMDLMSKLAIQARDPLLVNREQVPLVDVNELIFKAIEGIGGMDCPPRFTPGQNLPAVRIQEESVNQLVLNLVLNAQQAMGDQQGMIDIFTFCKGDSVFLVVEDTGPGMSADQIEYLFEPFRSSKKSGLGVGLFQCKRMVEDQKGTIRVESRVGQGTKIIVSFPHENTDKKEDRVLVAVRSLQTPD